MKKEITLPVRVAGLEFKNPFFVASGPTTKTVRQLLKIEQCGWAAASIKLTIDPAPYINRYPRYAIIKERDALVFTAEKRLKFEEGLRLVEDAKKVLTDLILFANITYAGEEGEGGGESGGGGEGRSRSSGGETGFINGAAGTGDEGSSDVGGWVNMAKKFEEVGADVIELNMCCPNMSYNLELTSGDINASTKHTGASLGQQADVVAEIVRAIKKAVAIPVFVKLTPEGGRIAHVAKELYAVGADAVCGTANRLGIPPIDLENPISAIYHLQDEISMSCYSGAWLKPLALRDTYEIRKVCGGDVKVMAAGGVRTAADALEMVMCGADLVGICAETLISGYNFIGGVIDDMDRWLTEHGATLDSIRSSIVSEVKTAPELTLYEGYAKIKNPHLAAPCKNACPHQVPAQAYIRKVAEGDIRAAFDIISAKGPLQSICGYVCDHKCEESCARGETTGNPIKIRDIKRFVLETGKKLGYEPDDSCAARAAHTTNVPPNGKRVAVAVVGGGPAGLSNAYYMRKAGYDVTIFEKEEQCGGMLSYAIPRFRLPEGIVVDEVKRLERMGVEIKTKQCLGADFSIESLKRDGYSAVFLGVGAASGKPLGIPGDDCGGVYQAVDFLKSVILGEGLPTPIGGTTVVIGGGFTAVDAARTAVRLGAEKVYIAYRRTRDEMPASRSEIEEAEAEGVKIMYLVSPVSIGSQNGKAVSISFRNQVLDEPDTSGRRKPADVEGAVFTIACDTIIIAAGQEAPEVQGTAMRGGLIDTDDEYAVRTIAPEEDAPLSPNCAVNDSWDGFIYAGGDATGANSVIRAIADGHRAACFMDRKLSGGNPVLEMPPELVPVDNEIIFERSGYIHDSKAPSLEMRHGLSRKNDFELYTRLMTPEEAAAEAKRCLKCGCGEGCALCKEICSDFAIDFANSSTRANSNANSYASAGAGAGASSDELAIDSQTCSACGMCYNLCPNKNIEIVSTGRII